MGRCVTRWNADDFISWEQANPNVEAVRVAIGRYEGWLFSRNRSKIDAYAYRAAEERNRLAAMIGRPPRDMPVLDATAGSFDPPKYASLVLGIRVHDRWLPFGPDRTVVHKVRSVPPI